MFVFYSSVCDAFKERYMVLGKIIGWVIGFVLSVFEIFTSSLGMVLMRFVVQGVLYGFVLALPFMILWNVALAKIYPLDFFQGWAILICAHIFLSRKGS